MWLQLLSYIGFAFIKSKVYIIELLIIVLGGHYYMAQDTIKCYDGPSDVVKHWRRILLILPMMKLTVLKRASLVLLGDCYKWFVRIT